MAKKKVIKKAIKKGSFITDIKREYFMEDGIEKVKCTHMSGSKVVKVEIENS